jgi:hypothetical protein
MILTASGERPAEALAPGEMLVTLSGRGAPLKPIRALRRGAGPAIRLRAGALGPMLPLRDLVLGAGQWLRCEAMLLPAGLLEGAAPGLVAEAAGMLIAIELEAHDLVVAEGTPLAALPLPQPSPPEPGLLGALRASLARRATPAPAPHPATAELDRLIGMPGPGHG